MNDFVTWAVDGPLPVRPVHGLLQAAEAPAAGVRIVVDTTAGPIDLNDLPEELVLPNAGRERWINGVKVYPYPANVPEVWDACASSGPDSMEYGTTPTPPEFAAMTVSEPITCTTQQVPDEDAFKARAVAVLAATESFAVAREFKTGHRMGGTYLLDGQGTFPNGDVATRPNHGLQVLEQAIAATGRLGIIHCSVMLATALLGTGYVVKDNTGVIRTINGNVVIPDAGYSVDQVGPPGHAVPGATEEWAFATGPVDIRRSEIFTTPDTLAEALDRGLGATGGRTNSITYWAERYYVVDWDTALQAGVLIDRCAADCAVGTPA